MKTITFVFHHNQNKSLDKPHIDSFGCDWNELDAAILLGAYLGQLGNLEPGRYDGTSFIQASPESPWTIRVTCGINGAGSTGGFTKDLPIERLPDTSGHTADHPKK